MEIQKKWIKELWLPFLALTLLMSCQPRPKDPSKDPGTAPSNPPATSNGKYHLDEVKVSDFTGSEAAPIYESRGIGGGGAMSGFSQSPYAGLWFVGTDMGTLFRSIDWGKTWTPIFHSQTIFSSNLDHSPGVGFFSDGNTVVHAPEGKDPQISYDRGKTWQGLPMSLATNEYIESWYGNSYDEKILFALSSSALWVTSDKGKTWQKIMNEHPLGLYLDYLAPKSTSAVSNDSFVIYTAKKDGIYQSQDGGNSWVNIYSVSKNFSLRKFSAGRDKNGLTLAFADDQGKLACSNAKKYLNDWGTSSLNNHYTHCGYLWVSDQNSSTDSLKFSNTGQKVGDHLKMAENDSATIIATGSTEWIRQYGTKVWMSEDAGKSFTKIFQQMNWDVNPYRPWPQEKMDYSAVGLDVGWYDDGYVSFSINQRNSSEFGGTGFFFLHSSRNKGAYWNAPFTKHQGGRSPAQQDKWSSTGLEVTSVYRLKFHPKNSQLAYAAMADISGMVSLDGGKSFTITSTGQNSIYDYAFDRNDDQVVYAVSGSEHDFPMDWHANSTTAPGGVFKSSDKGLSWKRLTPRTKAYNRQFLSVAFDSQRQILYAGSQGDGVARSSDGGKSWTYFNSGFPSKKLIIAQIEVDPLNGDVYALLSGNAPDFTNSNQTGIYRLKTGSTQWKLLRGTVHRPFEVTGKLWYYPTAFALDLAPTGDRSILYLVDFENNTNWLATGIWKSIDGGANWYRSQQYTHPQGISIDPNDPDRVYVAGLYQLDGGWGLGGSLYTNDAGSTWKENIDIPFIKNGRTVAIDPNNSSNVFYTFFGSGLLYGPRPQ